ncbi:MAG: hypothetical protein IKG40_02475 [Bacilli bacterium]|nr:hypothetical protein [Bacilli bacterium]
MSKLKNKVVKAINSLGYRVKLFIALICFFAFLSFSIFVIVMSFSIVDEKQVNYSENGDIDYRVYLQQNDFFEEDFLGKNKAYIASLIKNIDVDFNYIFKIDNKSDIDFDYDIIATLVIADGSGQNVFFEKDYSLLGKTSSSIVKGTVNNIKKTVKIDYNYYNNLANRFRINYGIDTTSNLVVKMKIKGFDVDDNLDFNNSSEMSITIPLSEREVSISMNSNEVNKKGKIISHGMIKVNNYSYLSLGIVLFIVSIIFFVYIIKLIRKNVKFSSKYDKYVARLLKEYDRLIVNTTTKPDKKGKKIFNIDSFDELLDVRDNLKLPIKYYAAKEHEKCEFYITHDSELYLLTITEKMFE